ncbi:MAG: glycoside hydrolase family 16 protein [Bacteroidales bacterium]|nr:glycoside hydrolase family 16 protein [Bacteroidales bacterium]MCF8386433.1 glycoside hydrolase family 16 protein [Bacteroidales bacterium]MCF8397143.1 glycoside hydrolase family 16 protein [Bacteroidales bacterium]
MEDSGDPYDLSIEIVSIDQEKYKVILQAEAKNTVEYWFYLEPEEEAEEINTSGYFEHTYEEPGDYKIIVRAYGPSDRYIKASKSFSISGADPPPEVPLSKGYISPLQYDGYQLVWQDEFNSNSINLSNWGFEVGDGCPDLCGWGNNELEYYRAENASVADSVLTIEARAESFGGRDYTSARMISRGKQSFQYGRVDIRALLPQGKGMWPALWMMGNDFNQVGWPNCGEIDIMEMIGGMENTCHGTAHWDDGQGHASYGQSTTVSPETLAEAYHVFSIVWDESSIKWFVDAKMYNELSIVEASMSEFHQEFWFIINVAVGGNWPGSPDATTVFPQQMKVDYVRVFQKDE